MKTTDEEEYYPKNSFDRFGDDLCGLVLSYQSLKECFRFECLSKQWQRCVFTRRHTLSVGKCNKVLIKSRVKENVNWIPTHNMQALESVVKKCANITSIDIEIHSEDTERVFEMLINSHKHSLRNISISFKSGINEQIVDRILGKYGSQLTAILVPPSGYQVLRSHAK